MFGNLYSTDGAFGHNLGVVLVIVMVNSSIARFGTTHIGYGVKVNNGAGSLMSAEECAAFSVNDCKDENSD